MSIQTSLEKVALARGVLAIFAKLDGETILAGDPGYLPIMKSAHDLARTTAVDVQIYFAKHKVLVQRFDNVTVATVIDVPHEVNKSIQRSIKRAVSKSKSAKGPTNESSTNGQEKSTPEAI
jgi:hypothetical protein